MLRHFQRNSRCKLTSRSGTYKQITQTDLMMLDITVLTHLIKVKCHSNLLPQSVFDKYYDVVDSTFNIFGYMSIGIVEQIEIIDNTYDNIPDNRSVNPPDDLTEIQKNKQDYQKVEKTKI